MNDETIQEIINDFYMLARQAECGTLRIEELVIEDVLVLLEKSLTYCDSKQHGDTVDEAKEIFNGVMQAEAHREILCCQFLMGLADCIRQEFEKALYLYQEIKNAYDMRSLDENFVNTHTYESLVQVKQRDLNLFLEISHCVYDINVGRMRGKDKLNITFLLKDSAEWSCEELYQKFSASPDMEVRIAVAPFCMGTRKTIFDTYQKTISYFQHRGMDVTGLYDMDRGEYLDWSCMERPDILFLLNPHYQAFEQSADICRFPLSVLNVYIPYGMMIYGRVQDQFNQMSHMLCWKIFCESPIHKEMAKKYSDIGDSNVEVSGYVKMDSFYADSKAEESAWWKIARADSQASVKKIIYAPHYSIREGFAGFGNFDKIYRKILAYAKDHKDTTSWVIRPHPMLRAQCVVEGLFKDEEEYDDYLQEWEDLPNASVSREGMYIDLFKTSDAMIVDSVSFLAEYLYAHKPMLFLTRDRQTFNDFGQKLREVLYTADGGDFDKICEFLEDVVLQEQDTMKEKRETFFRENLDYANRDAGLASDYIFHFIQEQWKANRKTGSK